METRACVNAFKEGPARLYMYMYNLSREKKVIFFIVQGCFGSQGCLYARAPPRPHRFEKEDEEAAARERDYIGGGSRPARGMLKNQFGSRARSRAALLSSFILSALGFFFLGVSVFFFSCRESQRERVWRRTRICNWATQFPSAMDSGVAWVRVFAFGSRCR